MEYVVRNKSGRITHYLKKTQLITGKWAISTKSFTDRHYITNINLPIFGTAIEAEAWLVRHYDREYTMNGD